MTANPIVTEVMSRAALVQLAKHLTAVAFKVSNVSSEDVQPVPLRHIARSLGIHVEVDQPRNSARSAGALWMEEPAQGSLFGDFSADIAGNSDRSRFTLAHEISHRLVELYGPSTPLERGPYREAVVDEVASHLLLPRSLLVATVARSKECVRLTLDEITRIHRILRVSLTCLIKRLNDLCREGDLDVANCAFTVAPAVSAKKRQDYAPRIQAVCAPREIFIPANKRLESLGMTFCVGVFRNAPLYKPGFLQDRLAFWRRLDWKRCETEQSFSYMIYETVSGRRLMLAVALNSLV